MVDFTTEEIILMRLYDLHDRAQLIDELTDSLLYVTCLDEKKLMRIIIDKLKGITDGDYDAIGLFPELLSYEYGLEA